MVSSSVMPREYFLLKPPDNLFSATASSERKYWGFLLFQKVIQDPNSYFKLFPSIFSHNLVRCLINQMQQKDRFLNRIAGKSLRVLVQTAETHPYTIPTILNRLMGRNGTYNFDKATKTKTISQILSMTSETDAKEVLDILAAPALRIER
jgi:DNA polymerase phi